VREWVAREVVEAVEGAVEELDWQEVEESRGVWEAEEMMMMEMSGMAWGQEAGPGMRMEIEVEVGGGGCRVSRSYHLHLRKIGYNDSPQHSVFLHVAISMSLIPKSF
jgi:hypothetical protein